MSAAAQTRSAAGALLGLTQSTPFRILLTLACLVVVPVLVVGAFYSVFVVVAGLFWGAFWPVAATAAGVLGLLGLARSRGTTATVSRARIRVTQLMIVIGMLGALGITASVAAGILAETAWTRGAVITVAAVAVPLLVLTLDGLARLQYLSGLDHERARGEGADRLPLLFLGLALASAAGVAVITLGG